MKWQNLIRRECPVCGSPLRIIDRTERYECSSMKCWFMITRRHIGDILADRSHPMRKHLTNEEQEILNRAEDESE